MFPDYYKRLDLNIDASREDIKKAYRALALKYHPDHNKSAGAKSIFIAINEAYSILYDSNTRAKYDIEYRNHINNTKTENHNRYEYTHQKAESDSAYKYKQQRYKEGQYTYEENRPFEDEDLNKKAKRAKKQGAEYAAMSFVNFSNQVVGMIKSTIELIISILLFIIYGLLGVSGVSLMLIGLVLIGYGMYLNWSIRMIIGSITFFLGFSLLNVVDRNDVLFKGLHVGLGVFGSILTFIGLGHLSLRLITSGGSGNISIGVISFVIGVLFWREAFKKLKYY